MSPSEGPPSGGELSGAVLHPYVHPEGLPGVAVLCGGKPVRGEESPRSGGIRQGQTRFLPSAFVMVSAGLCWSLMDSVVSSSVHGAVHSHQEEVCLKTLDDETES